MTCRILRTRDIIEQLGVGVTTFLLHSLTRPGSDFHRKLTTWLYTPARPTRADGDIAVVFDQGEVVGWARTERWSEPMGDAAVGHVLLNADGATIHWDTLEAFVAPEYRGRGVAAFAASGLYASVLHDTGLGVAVFRPSMILVARRAGLHPTLFEMVKGRWVQA